MDGVHGLLAWRWLFILEGAITVGIALCGYFILPNFPRTTKWLSEEEIQLAVWRLEEDIGEDDWVDSKQQSLWHGLALALSDIKTYTFVGDSIPTKIALANHELGYHANWNHHFWRSNAGLSHCCEHSRV